MLLLLDPYVDAILALALAYLSLKIVQALFGPLDGLPVIGGALASLYHAISKSLANACGTILHPLDVAVGGSFSAIASLIRRVGGVVSSHARILFQSAALIEALALAYHGIRSLTHDLHGRFAGIDTTIKSLEREFHGIEGRVKSLQHDLTRGIGHDLRLSLKADERTLSHLEHKVIPAIRGDVATAEGEISNLYDWAKGKAALLGVGTFAFAVAAVIGADLLNGLKCPSLLKSLGSRGCGLWNGLEDILGLLFDAVLFADLCSVIPEVTTLFGEFEQPLTELISAAANAACAHPPSSFENVPAVSLALPPNPGFTLSLP